MFMICAMPVDTPAPDVAAPSSPPGPVATFAQAFETWLADQRGLGLLSQDGSVAVYQDMWRAFMAWCLGQSPAVNLFNLELEDLQAFKAARFGRKTSDLSLTPRYALRLMRLIDRVLRHHAARTDAPVNKAAANWLAANPDIRYADASHADPLPDYLSTDEAAQLIAYLSEAGPQAELSWQEVRNRASVALQLGAGLTPGDVRALTLASVIKQDGHARERPWKLHVPGNGNSPARETPVAPWAAELLRHWLTVRADSGLEGQYLFPSTRTGKQWQKPSQYERARQVLEAAGMNSGEGGSFRLRHTFALRQLQRGTSPEEVARWLGIEPAKMKRYERVLPPVIDVV